MNFEPLTREAIDAAPDWMRGIPLRADRWRDENTRSLLAIEEDAPVAVGIIWTSRVHGDRYWFEIVVNPTFRMRGHARSMLSRLSKLRAADIPFMARGYVNEDRMRFLRALGGRTIQVVPPAQVDVDARTNLRQHSAVTSGASVGWGDVCAANAEVYEWTHSTWSPVGDGFASALNEDLEDELDLEATSVAVVDGRVVANCMVYHDSDPPIVTAETTHASCHHGEQLVEGCVRRSLDVLANRGVERAEFDGHVTDSHFLPVWTRLSPRGDWFHLVEVDAIGSPTTASHE